MEGGCCLVVVALKWQTIYNNYRCLTVAFVKGGDLLVQS